MLLMEKTHEHAHYANGRNVVVMGAAEGLPEGSEDAVVEEL